MKIKNLAFFGIMAAIMSVAGTARADTTTVIASQAYVDAKDELDEKTANKETATYTDSTNKTSTTVYPSMATLKDAYDTLNTAISNVNISDAVHDGIRDGETQTAPSENAVYDALADKQDTLTFDSTPTADSSNPVTSGGVKTALDAKQNNLGGSGQNGKVVTATNTAGTVTYTSIDGTVTANSTNLVTSGAVAEAIGDANSAVTNAYANNALTREGLEAASNLAKMAAVQDTIARQGTLEKAWSDEFDSTAATEGNATNLYNATTNRATNENAKPDNYVPTVAAVEKRVKSAIDEATQAASTSAANTYQLKSDSNVASNGNYITAGQGVGANLVALDTRAKANADNIATNTTSITTLNGDVSTAGSVLKSIQDNAETATFTPGNSGITATNLADAIKEVKTTAASGLADLDLTDTANNKPVTAVNQTDGQIAVTRGTISYAEGLKYDLSNINTQGGNGSSACVQGSPCTLTMFMNGNTPVYEWTNMDTESTNAVL